MKQDNSYTHISNDFYLDIHPHDYTTIWRATRQHTFNVIATKLCEYDEYPEINDDFIASSDKEFYTTLAQLYNTQNIKNKLFIFALCNNLDYNVLLEYSSLYERIKFKIITVLLKLTTEVE